MIWKESPFYLKALLCLFVISLAGLVVYPGQDILGPIPFSVLLAILLLPITNWLEKRMAGRVMATLISIIIALIIISGIIYF